MKFFLHMYIKQTEEKVSFLHNQDAKTSKNRFISYEITKVMCETNRLYVVQIEHSQNDF